MSTVRRFGTFGGVFTPSILTILGVIMYLRLPMIVGEAGLLGALGIILVAHAISFTTGLSVSSIATDKRVRGGGTYYMISRSLGLPIGGTLGLALFVGLSFSVSLYLIGFSESFLGYWGFAVTTESIRLTGTIVLLAVTFITVISTSLAIRAQYLIMAAIGLSLLSVFFGDHDYGASSTLLVNPSSAVPLMVLFGIFFPAVTGFEAGVSMSGDLRDPKKSIPLGSISAIVVGFVVYLGLAVFFATTVDSAVLSGDPAVLLKISLVPELLIAGIWGATISSALGSILGAPRILQATAADKISPSIFARGSGRGKEPRNALIVTFLIAEGGILIGELDVIARIVSIFFITTYGFLNLSCAFETWTSADFRPEFRVPGWVSLVGAVACIVVMIQLDFLAMLGGTLLLGGLFLALKRKELRLESGDAWNGVWASLVKTGIERLSRVATHQRNWRPNIIMFRGNEEQRIHLHELGQAISGRLGILSSIELAVRNDETSRRLEAIEPDVENDVHSFRHYCKDLYDGMEEVIRLYGFAGIRPNTVLMGWSKQEKLRSGFVELIDTVTHTDMNIVFLHHHPGRRFGEATTIDIWWNGRGPNLSFAITLLRHLTTSPIWRTARMRLLVINTDSSTTEKVHRNLRKILADYRISMDVQVIDNEEKDLTEEEIIQRESSEADLTVLGLRGPKQTELDVSVRRTHSLVKHLGSVLVIDGSSQFEDLDAGLQDEDRDDRESPMDVEMPLPQVPASRWPTVTADLQKIDANGDKILRLLYEKAFAPWFVEERQLVAALRETAGGLSVSLERALRFPEPYRRRKALRKIENEYLFRCRSLVKTIADDALPAQHERMADALEGYTDRLEKDVQRFPATIRLDFPREEFIPHRSDGPVLGVRKLWKRLLHSILGYPAGSGVPYRLAAEHFLLHRRHAFLSSYLKRFLKESTASLGRFKGEMVALAARLHEFEREVGNEDFQCEDPDAVLEAFQRELEEADEETNRRSRLFRNRVSLEFRKNLIAMQAEFDHFGIRQRLRKRRLSPKIFKHLVRANRSFPESWLQEITLVSNKISLDIAAASLRSRVHDRSEEFLSLVHQEIDSHLTAPLARLQASLSGSVDSESEHALELTLDQVHSIPESLDEAHEDILELTRTLPETLTVKGQDDSTGDSLDAIDVPVVHLTQYIIESKFISPVQEVLTEATERLRKIGFSVKDHLNLARFGLDNIDPDVADRDAASAAIVNKALDHLSGESKALEALKEEIADKTREALESAFEPLAPHLIVGSAADFTDAYRDYASKRVFSRFGALLKHGWGYLEERLIRLIYSRSEGMLLARRITRPAPSTASDLLDLARALAPKPGVLKALPQFYINLFSGRSSIGGDFWVTRHREEKAFEGALRRYRSGSQGAILLLGDRNSGKTALCRRVGVKHFRKGSVFHVFPPRDGSVDSADFNKALGQATGFRGTSATILRSIPHGSVVFLHDLELWFERHGEGTGVIDEALKLVENHAHGVLIVMNMNPTAYELMRQLAPLQEACIEQIMLSPMDAEELKEMILRRHKSSGMKFFLGRRPEQSLSRFSLARLFDLYFVCSDGNPGVALNQWLTSITRVHGDELRMQPPESPSTGALQRLSDDSLSTLTQFVIHKRLTPAKLARITGSSEDATRRTANRMTAIGVLEERSPDLYTINPVLDLPVRKTLRERRLI